MAVDSTGDLFVADTGNNRIVEGAADQLAVFQDVIGQNPWPNSIVNASGVASTVLYAGLSSPEGVAVDSAGTLSTSPILAIIAFLS